MARRRSRSDHADNLCWQALIRDQGLVLASKAHPVSEGRNVQAALLSRSSQINFNSIGRQHIHQLTVWSASVDSVRNYQ